MSCYYQVSRQNVPSEWAIRISCHLEVSTAVKGSYSVHTEPWKNQNDRRAADLTEITVPWRTLTQDVRHVLPSIFSFTHWWWTFRVSYSSKSVQLLCGVVIVRVMQFFICLSLYTHAASLKKQFVQSICSWSDTETPGSDTSNLHSHFPPVC